MSRDQDGVPVSRDVRVAFDALLHAIEGSGASLREMEPGEFDFALARLTFLRVFYPSIAAGMPPALRLMARTFGGMPFLDASLARYVEAEQARRALIAPMDQILSSVDALLCPVSSTAAFPHVKPSRMNGPLPIYTGGIDVDGTRVDYGTAVVAFPPPVFDDRESHRLPARRPIRLRPARRRAGRRSSLDGCSSSAHRGRA